MLFSGVVSKIINLNYRADSIVVRIANVVTKNFRKLVLMLKRKGAFSNDLLII